MNNEILTEIKGLNDSDLLTLYDEVLSHLQYLKESIILEEKEVSKDASKNQEAVSGSDCSNQRLGRSCWV